MSSVRTASIFKLVRRIAFFSSPALIMFAAYLILDPFDVVRGHNNYYANNPVLTNRDWVSTTLYERDVAANGYDAFIFGSSRSLAIRCGDWIPTASKLHCFHFDAWSETLFGILGKVRLIDGRNLPLRAAIIVVDESVLAHTADSQGHLFMKHPDVSDGGMLRFQEESASAFFSNLFVIKYLDFRINGEFRPYMKETLEDNAWVQLPKTNDLLFQAHDDAIAREGEGYWSNREAEFAEVATKTSDPQIHPTQHAMLEELASTLTRRGADVEVVIPPNFDRRAVAPSDVLVLRELFGDLRVHDFSGDNELSRDKHNFYDRSHFRPQAGIQMLRRLRQVAQ